MSETISCLNRCETRDIGTKALGQAKRDVIGDLRRRFSEIRVTRLLRGPLTAKELDIICSTRFDMPSIIIEANLAAIFA